MALIPTEIENCACCWKEQRQKCIGCVEFLCKDCNRCFPHCICYEKARLSILSQKKRKEDEDNDLLNPLNPLSPISPFNPLNSSDSGTSALTYDPPATSDDYGGGFGGGDSYGGGGAGGDFGGGSSD